MGWSAQRVGGANAAARLALIYIVSDQCRYFFISCELQWQIKATTVQAEVQVQRKRKLNVLMKGNGRSTDAIQSTQFGFDIKSGT